MSIFRNRNRAAAAVLGLALTLPVQSASATETLAPCKEARPPGTGFRSCAEVVSNPTTGSVTLLKKKISDHLTAIYKTGKEPEDELGRPGKNFGPTFCNVTQGPFNPAIEQFTNRERNSCGEPIHLNASISGSGPLGLLPPYSVDITYDLSNPQAETLESGYYRGTFAQALTCFEAAFEKQMINDHKISVSPACSSLGQDVDGLGSQSATLTAAFQQQLQGQVNIDDIDNWLNTGKEPPLNGVKDPGSLRQSALHLQAARTSLESAFTHLAACEVFSRASAAYQAVIADGNSQRNNSQGAITYMNANCSCRGNRSSSDAERCINNCYKQKLADYVRSLATSHWPNQPSSVSDCKMVP